MRLLLIALASFALTACARRVPTIEPAVFAQPRKLTYALAAPADASVAAGGVRPMDSAGVSKVLDRGFKRSGGTLPAAPLQPRPPASGATVLDPTEVIAAAFVHHALAGSLAQPDPKPCGASGLCPKGSLTVKVTVTHMRLGLFSQPAKFALREFGAEVALIDETGVKWKDTCSVNGLTLGEKDAPTLDADLLKPIPEEEIARRIQLLVDRAAIACGNSVTKDLDAALASKGN